MAEVKRLADRMKNRSTVPATDSTVPATEKPVKSTKTAPAGLKTRKEPKRRPFTREHRQALRERTAQQKHNPDGHFNKKWSEDLIDEIEKEYRAGNLPIAELSRIYGPSPATIVTKMKERGVSRDLSGAVAARLRDKILRDGQRPAMREGPGGRPLTEDEKLAEQAAQRAFKTVKLHQRGAAKLRNYTEKVISRLPTKAEMKDPKIIKMFSECARNAALALDKLVAIERKAFAIDEREDQAKRLKIELD